MFATRQVGCEMPKAGSLSTLPPVLRELFPLYLLFQPFGLASFHSHHHVQLGLHATRSFLRVLELMCVCTGGDMKAEPVSGYCYPRGRQTLFPDLIFKRKISVICLYLPENIILHENPVRIRDPWEGSGGISWWLSGKQSTCDAGDTDVCSIPGSGRSPGGGHSNPLQYSCLGKSHGQKSLVGYGPWGCRVKHNWWLSTHAREEGRT